MTNLVAFGAGPQIKSQYSLQSLILTEGLRKVYCEEAPNCRNVIVTSSYRTSYIAWFHSSRFACPSHLSELLAISYEPMRVGKKDTRVIAVMRQDAGDMQTRE